MRKLVLILLSLIIQIQFVSATMTVKEIVVKASKSVVMVKSVDKQGNEYFGTGFFINDKGYIMTNYHVVENAVKIMIKVDEKHSYVVTTIVNYDTHKDMIILVTKDISSRKNFLLFTNNTVEAGDTVIVVGNPKGFEKSASNGIVSGIREIGDYGKVFQITAPISNGSSGSPVLNLEGDVIGVASFQSVEGQNINFAVAAKNNIFKEKNVKFSDWSQEKKEVEVKNSGKAEDELNRGYWLYYVGKYESSMLIFEDYLKTNTGDASATIMLGYCNYLLGNYEKAKENFEKTILLDYSIRGAHTSLGEIYGILGDKASAEKEYQTEIDYNPDYETAYIDLSRLYLNSKRLQDGYDTIDKGMSQIINSASLYEILSEINLQDSKENDAITNLNKALMIDPYNKAANIFAGIYYAYSGYYLNAIHRAVILKTLGGGNEMGVIDTIVKNYYETAVLPVTETTLIFEKQDKIEKSLGIGLNDSKLYTELGNDYITLYDNVFQCYDTLKEKSVGGDFDYLEGLCEKLKNEYSGRAMTSYKNALKSDIKNAESYSNLAFMYSKLGEKIEALDVYKQGLKIKPEDPLINANIAGIYYTMWEKDYFTGTDNKMNMLKYVNKSLEIDPKQSVALLIKGLSYLKTNDKSEAMKIFEKLKGIDKYRADTLFDEMYK